MKMLRVKVFIEGRNYKELMQMAEHAAAMLKLNSPSENVTDEDGCHVDYTVQEIGENDSYAKTIED